MLEQERAAQLSHVETQRQAFALEKSALAKRYQVCRATGRKKIWVGFACMHAERQGAERD